MSEPDIASRTVAACALIADEEAAKMEAAFNATPIEEEASRDRLAARVRTAWMIAAIIRDRRIEIVAAVTMGEGE